MKINPGKKRIKENLESADKTSKSIDAFFYIVIAAFYPLYMGLAIWAALVRGWHPLKAFVIMTLFYIFAAAVVSFVRYKAVDSAYDLWNPRNIEGTRREDYSILSSMVIQGRFEEAEQEARNRFIQDRSPDIPQILGDLFIQEKRYADSLRWFQKGVLIAEGAQRLYFLERLVELTDRHIPDKAKLTMYLQKIRRDFAGTEAAEYTSKRLREIA